MLRAVPFTAAHPMAVLPLIGRLRLDTTCLVLGTMAPDFEYFVRFKQASAISHTWIGLIAWNLPATLILAIALHHLIKWPLVLIMPRPIARRAAAFANRPWGEWSFGFVAGCVVAALLGSLTHLLWDGVTHSDGLITPHVPVLRTPIDLPLFSRDMVLHRVLQHVSTVVGLVACLAFTARTLYRATPIDIPDRPRVWPRLAAFACIAAGLAFAIFRLSGRRSIEDIGNVVVVLISGALAGVVVTSVVLWRTAVRVRPVPGTVSQ